MNTKNTTFVVLSTVLLSGCMTAPKKPAMTPLEIQSLQSREYEIEKRVSFPSVMSVFQDLGYTISNADIQTGLISADISSDSDLSSKILLGITKVIHNKANIFIKKISNKTRARLNFIEVIQNSSG